MRLYINSQYSTGIGISTTEILISDLFNLTNTVEQLLPWEIPKEV
jgi:hypothetical protein